MSEPVLAGFVPLVDAAILIAAREMGFAAGHGIDLELVRQPSWALLRDHLSLGHIHCAHALAPLPIASRLGLGQMKTRVGVPFVLGRGGNAITVTRRLAEAMRVAAGGREPAGPGEWGRALGEVLRGRAEPLTLAMVYPFSGHNFELRYWLAAAGIHPDNDLRIVAVPPPLMVESMEAGFIDGFCVGEPWNSLAAAAGIGEIIVTKSQIFPGGIEKVLAVPESLLDDSGRMGALLAGLSDAAKWCDEPANRGELAELLARPEYVDTDPALIMRALDGTLEMSAPANPADFLYFFRDDANRPRVNEALWLYAQMRRWGQAPASRDDERTAAAVFRADVYAAAVGDESAGGEPPVEACDGVVFDGESVATYLGRYALATVR